MHCMCVSIYIYMGPDTTTLFFQFYGLKNANKAEYETLEWACQ